MFSGFCKLCFRLRTGLMCWFSLSFTICFGLHGHLQVCIYAPSLTTVPNTIFNHPAALYCSMGFAGYGSVCVQLYYILAFTVFHYMFRPTWPSSCVYLYMFLVWLLFLILYLSILLHCIVQWLLQVMFPSVCSFIIFWLSLSFTTCLGLYGHLQVCRIFIFICLKDSASRTRKKEQSDKHTRKET
jgi:hypothetical protein